MNYLLEQLNRQQQGNCFVLQIVPTSFYTVSTLNIHLAA